MRRSDKEIKDIEEIIRIIQKCDVCRLGLSDNNTPYIVPMNYGFEYVDEKLTLYFHCAKSGKKLDIIAKNPAACFEMDCSHKLKKASNACNYSMEYESVMGSGLISVCSDKAERISALKLLMKTYTQDREFEFSHNVLENVVVLKLEVAAFTGKKQG